MNAATQAELGAIAITSARSAGARRIAAEKGGAVIEVLEEHSGLEPAAFAAALARTLHLAAISMGELHELAPAFDVLPYTEAMQHGCALLRAPDGSLVIAFADPFDDTLRPWVEERIAGTLRWVWRTARMSRLFSRSTRKPCGRWTACSTRARRRSTGDDAGVEDFRSRASARTPARSSSWCTRPCTMR